MRNHKGEKIKIFRDRWGVPHIYAETEFGALFGQGYTMAEDRLPTIFRAYRKAVGRMAEVHGEDWLEHDMKQKLYGHEKSARTMFNNMPAFFQEAGQSFISGIQRYIDENPEKVTEDYLPLEPHLPIALGRYSVWDVILDQALSDLHGQSHMPQFANTRGSNAWAVKGSLTSGGHVIAHLDPHVPWAEDWLWHESHLHGGKLHAYGFARAGHPYFFFGHNQHISWTITMGGPDAADVYKLELNPENQEQYLYDGKWLELKSTTHSVKVKTNEGMKTVEQNFCHSHHGLVLEKNSEFAYAFCEPYKDELDGFEVWGRMNAAANLGEFLKALEGNNMSPFNLHYGDVFGNIFYIRLGRVPIRPQGYDWSSPVPGNTSASEWLGIHPIADLPQVLNPAAGWYQNCNISPESIIPDSPLNERNYRKYLLHGKDNDVYRFFPKGNTPRGVQALRRLSGAKRMDYEEAVSIAMDTYMEGAEDWVKAVTMAAEDSDSPSIAEAVRILNKWNQRADKASVATSIFSLWWLNMKKIWGKEINFDLWDQLRQGDRICAEYQLELLTGLERAVEHLERYFGTIHVDWQELFLVQRGRHSWSVSGNTFFPLRIMAASGFDEQGRLRVDFGQSCPTLVFLEKGNVKSFSALPYGISEDPDSPHFADQGQKLFSEGKLKNTWFQFDELLGNIEEEITLYFNH